MTLSFREPADLVFYARAVSRAHAFDPAGIHWTPVEAFFKLVVHDRVCISDPAAPLFFWLCCLREGKPADLLIALLLFHLSVIQGTAIYPGRRARLQPVAFKSQGYELFSQTFRC